jgi:hypothetical protein
MEHRTIERAKALLPGAGFTAQVTSGRTQTIRDAYTQAWQTLGGQTPEGPDDIHAGPGSGAG